MGGELVNGSSSRGDSVEGDQDVKEYLASSRFPYTEAFYKRFPYYLSIGMTEEQYWDGDCCLTKYYREAEEIRQERRNQEAWLQGMYIYDALARISPILHAFAKKGTKAQPYVEKAYPLTKKNVEEAKLKEEKARSEKGVRYMEMLMANNNKRFEERK